MYNINGIFCKLEIYVHKQILSDNFNRINIQKVQVEIILLKYTFIIQ